MRLLLLVARRHLVEGYKGLLTTAMVRGEVVYIPLALPLEIWVDFILPFLGRRDAFRGLPFAKYCEVCGQRAPLRCSACKAAYFCGRRCMKAGWKDHRTRCLPRPPKKKKAKEGGGGGTKRGGEQGES